MRPNFNAAVLNFVLIHLLVVSIFSTLVFAQNSNLLNNLKWVFIMVSEFDVVNQNSDNQTAW